MEKDQLFGVLRKLRADGRSVIIVTHKLNEIMELADRVTVMRDGQVVATRKISETSGQELTRLMVGREVNLRADKSSQKAGRAILQIENLRVQDEIGHEKVRGLSLEVHAGEILGIAGVDGNGQSELAAAILHLREIKGGRVLLNGLDVTKLSVAQHRAAGVSYVPADRRHVGSVTQMTVADNAILGLQRQYTHRIFRSIRESRDAALGLISRFGIRTAGIDFAAGKLSGGNLQKLILGREIMRGSSALVVEHPTRGLDVGAVEAVWGELLRAREEGKAILLISAELEEILNLSDRIAVMFEGRIMGVADAAGASVDKIGLMMAGIHPGNTPAALAINAEEAHRGEAL
jgi:simple sugar transport system ATP-binding protein